MSAPNAPLAVGYVLKRYPRFSETFVVNEILALEKAGVQVEIFAAYAHRCTASATSSTTPNCTGS